VRSFNAQMLHDSSAVPRLLWDTDRGLGSFTVSIATPMIVDKTKLVGEGRLDEHCSAFVTHTTMHKLVTAYLANLGYAYAASGRQRESRKALDSLLQLSRKQYVPAISIAEVYAGLGDKAQALEWLEKAYEERSRIFFVLKVDPTWNSLREEPKFQDLVRRMGLNP
jgi:tetratricopeptide (TPR) repeat protein